jgi:hypothetical protein
MGFQCAYLSLVVSMQGCAGISPSSASLAYFQAEPSGRVGQPIGIDGAVVNGNGCPYIDAMSVSIYEGDRTVLVAASQGAPWSTIFVGSCAQMIVAQPVHSAFTPKSAGTYRIRGTIFPLGVHPEQVKYLKPPIDPHSPLAEQAVDAWQDVVVTD